MTSLHSVEYGWKSIFTSLITPKYLATSQSSKIVETKNHSISKFITNKYKMLNLWKLCSSNYIKETNLAAATYQQSSFESDKLAWSDGFETLLSEVATKRKNVIILTGDSNIAYDNLRKFSKRCKDILHSLKFPLNVVKTTKKGKSLISQTLSTLLYLTNSTQRCYSNQRDQWSWNTLHFVNVLKKDMKSYMKSIAELPISIV